MGEPMYGTPEWDAYEQQERSRLEAEHGQVWDTDQLQQDFEVHSFLSPFCRVTRLSDGQEGWLQFQHSPRFYFRFCSAT